MLYIPFIPFFLSLFVYSFQSPLITDNLIVIAGQLRKKFNNNVNSSYLFSIDDIIINISNSISTFTADPSTFMDYNNGILKFSDVNSTIVFDVGLKHSSSDFTVSIQRRGIAYLNFNSISFKQSIENSLSLDELSSMSLHIIINDLSEYALYENVLDDENHILKEIFVILFKDLINDVLYDYPKSFLLTYFEELISYLNSIDSFPIEDMEITQAGLADVKYEKMEKISNIARRFNGVTFQLKYKFEEAWYKPQATFEYIDIKMGMNALTFGKFYCVSPSLFVEDVSKMIFNKVLNMVLDNHK